MIHDNGETIIGADFGLADVMRAANQVAIHESPVLLLGETGVGKDVIANHIHHISSRSDAPFIKVNCGAIPDALMDSELFGHEKGAFTGAISQKRGRFERADTGTIFLDEIGELPLAAQTRLLRVLQNKEIERVGGDNMIEVDIRVIAATHRDLQDMVRKGEFREDLWFRLNVFPITIPPLRARTDDIPALAEHLIEEKAKRLNLAKTPSLTRSSMQQLLAYSWPGNVRELDNIIERALIVSNGGVITFDGILSPVKKFRPQQVVKTDTDFDTLNQVMADHIKSVLAATNGRIHGDAGAAKILGINPSTLRSRMDKLKVDYGRESS